ncbi:hypothetical protein Tco_0265228 [Tanacetum coccineum]
MVMRVEKKLFVIELPISPASPADSKVEQRVDLILNFPCLENMGKGKKPVGLYVIKMKNYVAQLERLGYVCSLRDLNDCELNAQLMSKRRVLLKKAATPQVMAIQGGRIQKANKKSLNAKGKGKGKGKGRKKEIGPAYLAE